MGEGNVRREGFDSARVFLERGGCGQAIPPGIVYEAINAYLAGDTTTGKAILRDLVNATVGFEAPAAVNKSSKSLHRMLAPQGNPSSENFFGIVRALQKKPRVKLYVMAKAA